MCARTLPESLNTNDFETFRPIEQTKVPDTVKSFAKSSNGFDPYSNLPVQSTVTTNRSSLPRQASHRHTNIAPALIPPRPRKTSRQRSAHTLIATMKSARSQTSDRARSLGRQASSRRSDGSSQVPRKSGRVNLHSRLVSGPKQTTKSAKSLRQLNQNYFEAQAPESSRSRPTRKTRSLGRSEKSRKPKQIKTKTTAQKRLVTNLNDYIAMQEPMLNIRT